MFNRLVSQMVYNNALDALSGITAKHDDIRASC